MTDLPAYTANHAPPKARLAIGQAVKVSIYGVPGSLHGEVVGTQPLKARVTERDPVWHGAVLSREEAKIRKASP